jgi:hypothetical protein
LSRRPLRPHLTACENLLTFGIVVWSLKKSSARRSLNYFSFYEVTAQGAEAKPRQSWLPWRARVERRPTGSDNLVGAAKAVEQVPRRCDAVAAWLLIATERQNKRALESKIEGATLSRVTTRPRSPRSPYEI